MAVVHNMLGVVGKFSGRFDDAVAHYTRAGEIFRSCGVGDDVLGVLHHNLGGLAQRAAANLDGAVTDDHPILRAARERLAELERAAP